MIRESTRKIVSHNGNDLGPIGVKDQPDSFVPKSPNRHEFESELSCGGYPVDPIPVPRTE
jgi:hypothetical protein